MPLSSERCQTIDIRADFPMLKQSMSGKPLIYLDSAATSLKPQVVIDTISQFYAESYGTVHRAVYDLAAQATSAYQTARETVRRFINAASTDEIVFTRGTTEAINLVAASFGRTHLKAGDEVILSEMEHHSNLVPWHMLSKEKGVILKFIPVSDRAELILEEYERLLNPRTKLVSVAHIANATGTWNPVETIIALAHQYGAKVCIDGAQSAPHLPIDVQQMGADFFAFSGHKAFGPTGIGILYGKKEWLESMPPYQGGGDMIQTVTLDHALYQPPPLRFEAGTPAIAEVLGLGAALTYMERVGRKEMEQHVSALLAYATAKMEALPRVKLIGTAAKKGPIVTFAIQDAHPLDVGTFLNLRGIAVRTGHLCAQPTMRRFGITAAIRVSFAAYNTAEEIDFFINALEEILRDYL